MVMIAPEQAHQSTCGQHQTLQYHTMAIRHITDFEALGTEWAQLLSRADTGQLPLKHPLEHTWLSTWLKYFPPEKLLIILVWNDQGQLLAAAPLKISRYGRGLGGRALRCVQFIGTEPDVYDGIQMVMAPDADSQRVCRAIADQVWEDRAEWDMLDLRYGVSQAQFQALAEALAAHGMTWEMESPMSFHTVSLPASIEGYEACRKRNLKKSVTRRLNRLHDDYPEAPLSLQLLSSGPALEAEFNTFIQNHQAYWQAQGCVSDFKRFSGLKDFYRSMFAFYEARDGERFPRFLFSILRAGHQAMGYQLSWCNHNTLLTFMTSYQEKFKKYAPGTLHIEELIRYVIAQGHTAVNLGRGDEPYKAQWETVSTPLWNLRVFKTKWVHSLWAWDQGLKNFIAKPRRLTDA